MTAPIALFLAACLAVAVWAVHLADRRRFRVQRLADDLTTEVAVRRTAETAARESEQLVFRFLDALPVGALVLTAAGRPHYANTEAKRLLGGDVVAGAGLAAAPDRHLLYLTGTDDAYPILDLAGGAASEGRAEHRDDLEVHGPAGITPLEVWGAPVHDADGEVAYAVAVFVDISERRAAEQAVARARADLERSNNDLEQFAYVASHDLSEPLRAISGPLDLLARRYEGQLDDEADTFIRFAVDGCARMQKMIDALLVYSRIGRMDPPLVETDCRVVVDHVLAVLARQVDETGAVVEVGELPKVLADSGQLHQVFQNLLSNALKFRRPGIPPSIAVVAGRQGDMWRFEVTDDGIGIDPRHHERIFAMFKRLHGRGEFPGTGIGLSLVKKIVEHHGGAVGVEPAPVGPGTRFWFTLPVGGAPAWRR